jgi:arsenate reductase
MKLYHNPRCGKSRCALTLLEGKEFEVVEYLKNPLTAEELKALIAKIGISPLELIRKSETDFKENYKGKDLSDDEWIAAMVKFPKLMERPILEKGDKAIVGRPPEDILDLL